MISCCQTRTMERKSQLKTIKVRLFSVSLVSLSCSCFWPFWRRETRRTPERGGERTCLMSEWRLRLLNSYEALQGTEWQRVTPCHLWPPPSVWDQWRCRRLRPDTTGGVTEKEKLTESWAHNSGLLTDAMEWFLSQQRATVDFSPLSLEVLKPFSYGWSCPAHAPALFCLFCSHFNFINVSFAAFLSPWHDFLWISNVSLHFCFAVVWILPALCLKSWVQCLQVEFEPLFPVLRFDLMEFVFH